MAVRPTNHDCRFDEVIIGEDDEDGILKKDMRVLLPCTCGETPLDNMEMLESYYKEMQAAVEQLEPFRLLFHWSPARRFKQIKRYGLRPFMNPTTELGVFRAPYVCFADSPDWAWRLSGGMSWHPKGEEWDLWMTSLDRLTAATVLPSLDRPSGIYEVRNEARVYKRDLMYIASRFR